MIHEIALLGIDEIGYHGVFDHERREGQPFVVDLHLHVEIDADSDEPDDLAATADYGRIIDMVRSRIAGEPVNLIETLARNLLAIVLDAHPAITRVQVTVHKPKAPVSRAISDISVTVSGVRSGG